MSTDATLAKMVETSANFIKIDEIYPNIQDKIPHHENGDIFMSKDFLKYQIVFVYAATILCWGYFVLNHPVVQY